MFLLRPSALVCLSYMSYAVVRAYSYASPPDFHSLDIIERSHHDDSAPETLRVRDDHDVESRRPSFDRDPEHSQMHAITTLSHHAMPFLPAPFPRRGLSSTTPPLTTPQINSEITQFKTYTAAMRIAFTQNPGAKNLFQPPRPNRRPTPPPPGDVDMNRVFSTGEPHALRETQRRNHQVVKEQVARLRAVGRNDDARRYEAAAGEYYGEYEAYFEMLLKQHRNRNGRGKGGKGKEKGSALKRGFL
ncbi:hypothetical protein MMC10_000386 [Thelotrema lepadinum]|nr:hypothetical protein [Thelotrema lepadinum]